jgi:amino acid transporter
VNLKVHKKRLTPINSVFLTAAVSLSLSLMVLGSMTAFYGIVGLAQATQAMSYILAISSVLYRRIKSPETMPKARWSLGSIWGPIVNILAIVSTYNESTLQLDLLSAGHTSASDMLILLFNLVVFDQLLHLVVHSTELASYVDKLQRIGSALRRFADIDVGDVSVQEGEIRRPCGAHEGDP